MNDSALHDTETDDDLVTIPRSSLLRTIEVLHLTSTIMMEAEAVIAEVTELCLEDCETLPRDMPVPEMVGYVLDKIEADSYDEGYGDGWTAHGNLSRAGRVYQIGDATIGTSMKMPYAKRMLFAAVAGALTAVFSLMFMGFPFTR